MNHEASIGSYICRQCLIYLRAALLEPPGLAKPGPRRPTKIFGEKKSVDPEEHSTWALEQLSQKPDFILQPALYMTFNFMGWRGLVSLSFYTFHMFFF